MPWSAECKTCAGKKRKLEVAAGTKRVRRVISIPGPEGSKDTREMLFTNSNLVRRKDGSTSAQAVLSMTGKNAMRETSRSSGEFCPASLLPRPRGTSQIDRDGINMHGPPASERGADRSGAECWTHAASHHNVDVRCRLRP